MYASNWNAFGAFGAQALKRMDRSRQARGRMLERAGYGPQQTPSTVILDQPGLNLRRFQDAPGGGPAVLLVPAPIKRAYIWDLAPDISVVRRWSERGYRVYLAEWLPMPDGDPDVGLDDYGDRLLSACQRAIAQDSGQERLTIVGHSLGGILAAIYSCRHPERVAATVLLESPLHFEQATCCFSPLVNATPHARGIADAFRHVPGVYLNMMSALAEPQAFGWERIADRWLSLLDPKALATHMRVERWTHDEFPLPGRLFTEIVESLYRNDEFMQGTLDIGGRTIGPRDLRAPLVSVVDFRSKVIPPDAVLPFHEATGSERRQVFSYQGDVGVNLQHVGVLVGRSAHATIWPAIFDWLGAPAMANASNDARAVAPSA
ncbi:alpha/beta fold hydrolase [Telluria beijingensis]|uniref:alpha/beta fold hydrolase n=1 Tax=Telluria beijingensis TaxID=3068633 RepID=UPI002795F4D4|nr:alpha/beta fold hydrolase [Massilia sp. REN29]